MSTLTVSKVIARFDTALQLEEYNRSGIVPELFGRDTDHLLHKAYSIAAPSTDLADFDGREHYGDEGEAQTIIEVRTAYRLRPDGQPQDYSKALTHEHEVIKTILAKIDLQYISVAVEQATRRVTPGGDWLISLARFRVFHRYQFQ